MSETEVLQIGLSLCLDQSHDDVEYVFAQNVLDSPDHPSHFAGEQQIENLQEGAFFRTI